MSVSARTNTSIDQAWSQMSAYQTIMIDSGELAIKRSQQLRKWMWNNIRDRIVSEFLADQHIQSAIQTYEQRVVQGLVTPFVAADAILDLFARNKITRFKQE
jgi:LAO/AO transport system kinase